MMSSTHSSLHMRQWAAGIWALVAFWGTLLAAVRGQPAEPAKTLRIGTSGSLASANGGNQDKLAVDTLKAFIQSETGFRNDIKPQENYRALVGKLAGKELDLGLFQGHEFAWARAHQPDLKPLALAVNVYPYRYAVLVVRQNHAGKGFDGLQGHGIALPEIPSRHLQLFMEQQIEPHGQAPEQYFAKITRPKNLEDALDDVVDGIVAAAVVDQVGLEAYQRRKPGRFRQLKAILRSPPFPPPLVAYCDGHLDAPTLQRFRDGLIEARRKEKGQQLLTLFKLTGFAAAPQDFDQVVEQTRQAFPPPEAKP